MARKQKTFIATAGQTVFDIADVGHYVVGQNLIIVHVGGVIQISGSSYTETSETTFTMTDGVTDGVEVHALWDEEYQYLGVSEPITLAEAKAYMKIDYGDDDEMIEGLITAARQLLEEKLNVGMITKSYTEEHDGGAYSIRLKRSPVTAVETVTLNGTDTTTEIPANMYIRSKNVLKHRYGQFPRGRGFAAVTVTYTGGYADAINVPRPLTLALKQLTAYMYENRGDDVEDIPEQIWCICKPYFVPIDLMLM